MAVKGDCQFSDSLLSSSPHVISPRGRLNSSPPGEASREQHEHEIVGNETRYKVLALDRVGSELKNVGEQARVSEVPVPHEGFKLHNVNPALSLGVANVDTQVTGFSTPQGAQAERLNSRYYVVLSPNSSVASLTTLHLSKNPPQA